MRSLWSAMIEHEAEIFSRPARTWFQTGKEKAKAEGEGDVACHLISAIARFDDLFIL